MERIISNLKSHLSQSCNTNELVIPERVLLAPATLEEIAQAERNLGFAICPLLKRIYFEIGDGGFGPGQGLIGIGHGYAKHFGDTADTLYKKLVAKNPWEPGWYWPNGLLPFCDWGFGTYSCVDCNKPGHPIVYADPVFKEPEDDMDDIFIEHKNSVKEWFEDWLMGKDLWDEVFG
jgi:hypothetical protein